MFNGIVVLLLWDCLLGFELLFLWDCCCSSSSSSSFSSSSDLSKRFESCEVVHRLANACFLTTTVQRKNSCRNTATFCWCYVNHFRLNIGSFLQQNWAHWPNT